MKSYPVLVYEVSYEPRTDLSEEWILQPWAYTMAPTLWKTQNLANVEVLRFNHSAIRVIMIAIASPRQVFTEPLT